MSEKKSEDLFESVARVFFVLAIVGMITLAILIMGLSGAIGFAVAWYLGLSNFWIGFFTGMPMLCAVGAMIWAVRMG